MLPACRSLVDSDSGCRSLLQTAGTCFFKFQFCWHYDSIARNHDSIIRRPFQLCSIMRQVCSIMDKSAGCLQQNENPCTKSAPSLQLSARACKQSASFCSMPPSTSLHQSASILQRLPRCPLSASMVGIIAEAATRGTLFCSARWWVTARLAAMERNLTAVQTMFCVQ